MLQLCAKTILNYSNQYDNNFDMKNISCLLIVICCFCSCKKKNVSILVFSKTEGYRHESISEGIQAIYKMAEQENWNVDTTEDASFFQEENLTKYSAVIFLNTTGDILDNQQQSNFERYIQAGGGFVGVHAATDTEYDWKWYKNLVGAYFDGHPKIQEASIKIIDKKHISCKHLGDEWIKKDEWYNFKDFNESVNILLDLDEQSYEGGTHNGPHPIAWNHDYDGGRSFYTGLGHTKESYVDNDFIQHLKGGIIYAVGGNSRDYSKSISLQIPEENRFTKEVLDFNLNEPMQLKELPGIGILFIERGGEVKLFSWETEQTKLITELEVFYGNEDGLLGLAIDPSFRDNGWIYLFYSALGEVPVQHISRFKMFGDSLDLTSEKILLEIPTIRKCCHSGGGMAFGSDGLLYIGVGDNTNPFESDGFAPTDERDGRAPWDAQRSASNTNDLRGKILRIQPEADGSYSIPAGNLFAEGKEKTRPEIYAMGLRNPFRFSIDSKNQYLYWGDVGPDAGAEDSLRGPEGMGEINQARAAGNWGWPYTRGNNFSYGDYNFSNKQTDQKFDIENLVNNSPNNTGITNLPKPNASMIWYSYAASKKFPWLGDGGVNPMAGPVFHRSDFGDDVKTFPSYFEDKLFVYEWMRDWIYLVELDENQDYKKADPFMPSSIFSHPMDMIFASDGSLYVLEYGQLWNTRNMDARLNRISYIDGNRPPRASIVMDKTACGTPCTVRLSADGSVDYDKDSLSYQWTMGDNGKKLSGKEVSHTFTTEGVYDIKLKVLDGKGGKSITKNKLLVGNEAPKINIDFDINSKIALRQRPIKYSVSAYDKEDGYKQSGRIERKDLKVTMNYIPEGKDMILASVGHQQTIVPQGLEYIMEYNCKACHDKEKIVNGPSYKQIANKYSFEDVDDLVMHVKKGSNGIWGEKMMSAHPHVSVEEARSMVSYILSLNNELDKNVNEIDAKGMLIFDKHKDKNDAGKYVLMASYKDKGNERIENSELSVARQVVFYPPKIQAEEAVERSEELGTWDTGDKILVSSITNNSFIAFDSIQFNELSSIDLNASYIENYAYQGSVELRVGDQNGPVIGTKKFKHFNESKAENKIYNLAVEQMEGMDKLYLMFHNKVNKQFVMNLDWIYLNYE